MNADFITDLESHLSAREERIASAEKSRLETEQSRQHALSLHKNAAVEALKSSVIPELEKIVALLHTRGYSATAMIQKISGLDVMIGADGDTVAALELKAGPISYEKHSIRFIAKSTETSWSVRCTVESHDNGILNAFKTETWPGVDESELPDWASSKTIEFIKSALP